MTENFSCESIRKKQFEKYSLETVLAFVVLGVLIWLLRKLRIGRLFLDSVHKKAKEQLKNKTLGAISIGTPRNHKKKKGKKRKKKKKKRKKRKKTVTKKNRDLTPRVNESSLGVSQFGVSELGVSQFGVSELGVSQIGVSQIGASQLGVSQMSSVGMSQLNSESKKLAKSLKPGVSLGKDSNADSIGLNKISDANSKDTDKRGIRNIESLMDDVESDYQFSLNTSPKSSSKSSEFKKKDSKKFYKKSSFNPKSLKQEDLELSEKQNHKSKSGNVSKDNTMSIVGSRGSKFMKKKKNFGSRALQAKSPKNAKPNSPNNFSKFSSNKLESKSPKNLSSIKEEKASSSKLQEAKQKTLKKPKEEVKVEGQNVNKFFNAFKNLFKGQDEEQKDQSPPLPAENKKKKTEDLNIKEKPKGPEVKISPKIQKPQQAPSMGILGRRNFISMSKKLGFGNSPKNTLTEDKKGSPKNIKVPKVAKKLRTKLGTSRFQKK